MKVLFDYNAKLQITKSHEKNHFTHKSVKREFYKFWEKSIIEHLNKHGEKSLTLSDNTTGLKIWFLYDTFASITKGCTTHVIIVRRIEVSKIWES